MVRRRDIRWVSRKTTRRLRKLTERHQTNNQTDRQIWKTQREISLVVVQRNADDGIGSTFSHTLRHVSSERTREKRNTKMSESRTVPRGVTWSISSSLDYEMFSSLYEDSSRRENPLNFHEWCSLGKRKDRNRLRRSRLSACLASHDSVSFRVSLASILRLVSCMVE